VSARAVELIAHIGNVPIEEWLPFLVPIVALFIYGRRRERRRHREVGRLPHPGAALDERTVKLVEDEWARGKHDGVSREHLPLLYPPGPDGMSAVELAGRAHADPAAVERLLEELRELDYLEIERGEGSTEPRVWLTFRGYELVDSTEFALLGALQGAPSAKGA
jgi:hypothetical protein